MRYIRGEASTRVNSNQLTARTGGWEGGGELGDGKLANRIIVSPTREVTLRGATYLLFFLQHFRRGISRYSFEKNLEKKKIKAIYE